MSKAQKAMPVLKKNMNILDMSELINLLYEEINKRAEDLINVPDDLKGGN